MNRRQKRRRTSAFTLVEISVVIAVIGILSAATFYGIGGMLNMQNGTAVSQDLKEICQAQKKAIIRGLYNPPSLNNYLGGPTTPPDWLTMANLTDVSNGNFLNTNNFSLPITSYNTANIPPTVALDGQSGDTQKIDGVARSGDGLYDIGYEN